MYVCMYRGDCEHLIAPDGNLAIVSETLQHGVLRALRTCATSCRHCHTYIRTYLLTYINFICMCLKSVDACDEGHGSVFQGHRFPNHFQEVVDISRDI